MRRLVWILLVLAVLWCLWWASASAILRAGIDGWLEARRDEGWQAEVSAISGGGFPQTLVAQMQGLAVADPQTGVAMRASGLRIEAAAIWPGQAAVRLPSDGIDLRTPDGAATLVMADGRMSMDLAPGLDLMLRDLAWTAGPWGLSGVDGPLVSADTLTLAMRQGEVAEAYRLDISAEDMRPGEVIRRRLLVPDDWPVAFDSLRVDADITFDRPWDLRSLEDRRPQPRRIDLHLAEAAWGSVRVNLATNLVIDAQGLPTGEFSLQAENWRDLLRLAERAGILPPRTTVQAEGLLERFASLSGNPTTIDVTLSFRNGRTFIGFLPIGPAPVIGLR